MYKKIIIVFGMVLLYFLGIASSRLLLINNSKNADQAYQAGWNDAKKRIIETGYYSDLEQNFEINILQGEISKISDGRIFIKSRALSPLADPSLNEREVLYNQDTKIYESIKKDSVMYEKELADAMKKERRPDSPNSLPTMYEIKDALSSSFQVGQQVIVKAGRNLRDIKQIEAQEITILGF